MRLHINKSQLIYMVILMCLVLSVVIGITAFFFPENYHHYLSSPEKIFSLIGVALLTCVGCLIAGKAIRFSSSNSEKD